MRKFDICLGNPAYNSDFSKSGENGTYAAPIYNKFLDEAFKVADKVEMIHPARFLFNAGSTPKDWNAKMLNDPHFKILSYEEDATKVFPNTLIKGGVVISYHDSTKRFDPIRVFTKHKEMSSILNKVVSRDEASFQTIVVTRTAFRLTEKVHKDHPRAINQLSKGHPFDMSTNIFERLPEIFFDEKPNDGSEYIKILGRDKNTRVYKFIKKEYVNNPANLMYYKIYLPSANGNGEFGESLTSPVIAGPKIGATETFISVGNFETKAECLNALQYIKSKFCRALLNVLKTTQHLTPEVWKYVPLQDFTSNSDIDWSKSVKEIDEQLYRKYNLDPSEIEFIETHVKEMI